MRHERCGDRTAKSLLFAVIVVVRSVDLVVEQRDNGDDDDDDDDHGIRLQECVCT